MLSGFLWLFNDGLRTPYQRAVRQAQQDNGVPICQGCGDDLGLAAQKKRPPVHHACRRALEAVVD